MLKKGLSFFLCLVLMLGICSCSVNRERVSEQTGATKTTLSSTADSSEGVSQTEETTAAKSEKEKKKNTSTTQNRKTESSSKGSATTTKRQSATTKQQTTRKQSTTGKQQSTTKKQSTTKQQTTAKKNSISVSLSIDCSQALGKVEGLPASGWFLSGVSVSVANGGTVYDALCKGCAANGVSVTASNTMYGMYVSAIGGLAEKETGKMSGWTYTVNGKYPPKACDKYILSDGEKIRFIYKAS